MLLMEDYKKTKGETWEKSIKILTKEEGIIPALESSHAIAYVLKIAKNYSKDDCIIVNLSGRGDKDIETILRKILK